MHDDQTDNNNYWVISVAYNGCFVFVFLGVSVLPGNSKWVEDALLCISTAQYRDSNIRPQLQPLRQRLREASCHLEADESLAEDIHKVFDDLRRFYDAEDLIEQQKIRRSPRVVLASELRERQRLEEQRRRQRLEQALSRLRHKHRLMIQPDVNVNNDVVMSMCRSSATRSAGRKRKLSYRCPCCGHTSGSSWAQCQTHLNSCSQWKEFATGFAEEAALEAQRLEEERQRIQHDALLRKKKRQEEKAAEARMAAAAAALERKRKLKRKKKKKTEDRRKKKQTMTAPAAEAKPSTDDDTIQTEQNGIDATVAAVSRQNKSKNKNTRRKKQRSIQLGMS